MDLVVVWVNMEGSRSGSCRVGIRARWVGREEGEGPFVYRGRVGLWEHEDDVSGIGDREQERGEEDGAVSKGPRNVTAAHRTNREA